MDWLSYYPAIIPSRCRHAVAFATVMLSLCSRLYAQTAAFGDLNSFVRHDGIVHQYPLSGATAISPRTDIGIRAVASYDRRSLDGLFFAIGSRSGRHSLKVHLSRDRRTAIFHPDSGFSYDESVRFEMRAILLGGRVLSDSFSFQTMRRPFNAEGLAALHRRAVGWPESALRASAVSDDTALPMIVTVDKGATPGDIYFANFGWGNISTSSFLFLLDERGNILRDRVLSNTHAQDFKLQPNGMRTYYDVTAAKFYGMDSAWNVIDSFEFVHGAIPDGHELRVFPDGGYAMIGVTEGSRDLRHLVDGGDADASIYGNIIQIADPDHNVYFEWRGIDHYNVVDAIHENLDAPFIDFEHMNSLEFDSDRNIIVSNRHLCEITKINGETGDMIWRFGGAHNQFKLLGDSIWFSYQHAVRLLPNGHLLLLDNSNFDTISGSSEIIHKSRALEYELDTVNMTARLVWQYHHSPETYTDAMGYVERLGNGHTFIGWGDDTLAITELDAHDTTVFEMVTPTGNFSYRAIKVPFEESASVPTGQSDPGTQQLHIGSVPASAVVRIQYRLSSAQEASLTLYDLLGRTVQTLQSSTFQAAGPHEVSLDCSALANSPFFLCLRTADGTTTKLFEPLK